MHTLAGLKTHLSLKIFFDIFFTVIVKNICVNKYFYAITIFNTLNQTIYKKISLYLIQIY